MQFSEPYTPDWISESFWMISHNFITLAFHNLTLRSLLKWKSESDCIKTVCNPWKPFSTFHKEKKIC